jgi:DNA-binding MarR family transcriptional regulator
MIEKTRPGLGELLRYVGELVEQGGEDRYRTLGLDYRARYTPVMRALSLGAETVSEIVARSHLTQGAISQSVALMTKDGLIEHHALSDGRKNGIHLTPKGRDLLARLEPHWDVIFRAIETLEEETGFPLLRGLEETAKALENRGFAERLREADDER